MINGVLVLLGSWLIIRRVQRRVGLAVLSRHRGIHILSDPRITQRCDSPE